MKKRHLKKIGFPLATLACMLWVILVIACSDFFQPLITYIHESSITPLQGTLCILISGAGFWLVYTVLVKLGASFLPEDSRRG